MRTSLRRRIGASLAAMLLSVAGLAVVAPTPAHAELEHPRQAWMRNGITGLFMHWGMRTSPAHTSCSAWESAVTNGGWSASYWVNEARKLRASYIVLATFHSRLGYARPWPSAVPGSCRTNRDFLGELINEGVRQNVKIVLYMTDDPQWFNEGLGSGQSWLNSSAYSNWKGRSVNLHTRDGFGEFSYDLWVEVLQRYPNLSGFWVDNDNAVWEERNLYERVRSERPTWTLTNNNEDTPIMDTVSNEQKTGMSPSYDYPAAVYTAAPRIVEGCYKLPSSGPWWYGGGDPSVDRRLNMGRIVANAGSSVKSLINETPMKAGRMPAQQESFNNFTNGYLPQIWGALEGTEGGGYMHGGLKPGFWNDGAHGVTTVSKSDPNLHFIHVITRPSGSTLRLRDNGYSVSRVTNFRTGATVSFSQSGGNLTLTGISAWDQYDTVFRVETNGRQGIYPPSTYTMSASASAGGHPASHAADGNYRTYWDSNRTVPVNLRFDLGQARRVQYLAVNQREWSPTHQRDTFGREQSSSRINGYRVYFSNDGSNWGSPVRTGNLPSHRGVQIIDLPATDTRHVRLEVTSNHTPSSPAAYARLLGIDEAWIGSQYAGGGPTDPPPPPPPPPPNRDEAETAAISQGAVETQHAGFSGTGYVNTVNAVGPYVEWTVTGVPGGGTILRFGYANGVTTNRPMALSVNGGAATTVNFPATGAWTNYAAASATVNLQPGTNTIRLTATVAEGGPNLDYLDLTLPG